MTALLKSFAFVLILFFLTSRPSYAYLDPGSGSYLLQILLAGLLAASFMLKSFWQKLRAFFSRFFNRKKPD